MRPNEIRTVFEYGYWAFERVWDCVVQLSDEQFVQELGYSQGSISHQIVHLMSATQRWIIRLKREPMQPHLAFEDFDSRAAAKSKWDELRADAMAYVNSLSEADLDTVIPWELPARGLAAENPRWEILLHAANHATDHRAQILAMLNQHFGIETPEQDMLFYLLEAK
ncbi:MAG: DinB family protein [Chloroflexota bacterium]